MECMKHGNYLKASLDTYIYSFWMNSMPYFCIAQEEKTISIACMTRYRIHMQLQLPTY